MEGTENRKLKLFRVRADEASKLIEKMITAGSAPQEIADKTGVSERTVYRWWREGHAPHPILLDALRKLALKKGIDYEAHQEGQH